MTTKRKSQPTTPATVLVITLEPDGSGSLLARRGELAHLSQFTYSGLTEIVAAMQQGATALIEVETNPPAIDVAPAPQAPVELNADTQEEAVTGEPADVPDPLAVPTDLQPKLI